MLHIENDDTIQLPGCKKDSKDKAALQQLRSIVSEVVFIGSNQPDVPFSAD